MDDHSQFAGYTVQVELKDGKLIQGNIAKATTKGLTLNDVKFGDGGTSQAFKVRSSRLKDLKVLGVPSYTGNKNSNRNSNSNSNNNSNNNNDSNNNTKTIEKKNNMDWQDDDVKKIKNAADFDFQSNLTLFNKKDIFAQLKEQDEIDPEKRLVSFNKKTSDSNHNETQQNRRQQNNNNNNNSNYDYDEMVIPNAKEDSWNKVGAEFNTTKENEIEDFESGTEDEEDEIDESSSNGVNNNKRVNQKPNDNDDDTDDDDDYEYDDIDDPKYLPITKSINITHILSSAVNKDGSPVDNNDNNAQILSQLEKMLINNASSSRSNSVSNSLPTLKNTKNNQLIPMASPVELLEIERITNESFAIPTETLNEIFGNNASYLIKQNLGGSSRLTIKNSNPEPLIIMLVSDMNRSGIKAITLARYLCQLKQIRVIMLFSCPINDIQDKFVLNKIEIFKSSGGKIVNSLKNLNILLSKLNSPVEMIIDAMQGFDSNLSDFRQSRSSNQKIIEIVNWCNETKKTKNVKIWSIDIPSGYDSSSGLKNFDASIDKVDKVLCSYSWPLTCLKFMGKIIQHDGVSGSENNNPVAIIDCGIPSNVYLQKNSLRKFNAVDTFVNSGALGLAL